MKDFGEEFGVEVKVETFYNMEEAIAKIQTGQVTFDVFFPTMDYLAKLVAAKLVQPLTTTTSPTCRTSGRPSRTPSTTRVAQYSVPYAVYHTGISWRTDLLPLEVEDVPAIDEPLRRSSGSTASRGRRASTTCLVTRSLLGMYHLEGDAADPNTSDPAKIEAAQAAP